MKENVHFSSKTDDWSTPQELFDKLESEFSFDVDVCATKENTKCFNYWTKEDDGLSKDWTGLKCWMNPPYGREIGKWIKKASESNARIVVALIPARTDTRWWHDYIQDKADVKFIKGRLKFGGAKNSAPFPSCIVYFAEKTNEAYVNGYRRGLEDAKNNVI